MEDKKGKSGVDHAKAHWWRLGERAINLLKLPLLAPLSGVSGRFFGLRWHLVFWGGGLFLWAAFLQLPHGTWRSLSWRVVNDCA